MIKKGERISGLVSLTNNSFLQPVGNFLQTESRFPIYFYYYISIMDSWKRDKGFNL